MKKKGIIKNQEGSALIPVLCILCILAAFVLAMVFSSYQVLTRAQRAATKEQCRMSSVTFEEQFQKMLEEDSSEDDTVLNEAQKYFYNKIFVEKSWKYYNKEEENHSDKEEVTKVFNAALPGTSRENVGDVTIKMYWEWNEEDSNNAQYQTIVLVVKVKSSLRGQQYTSTTQYELRKPDTDTTDWNDTSNWKWAHSWSGN